MKKFLAIAAIAVAFASCDEAKKAGDAVEGATPDTSVKANTGDTGVKAPTGDTTVKVPGASILNDAKNAAAEGVNKAVETGKEAGKDAVNKVVETGKEAGKEAMKAVTPEVKK